MKQKATLTLLRQISETFNSIPSNYLDICEDLD
jgi:hypothetical protein